MVSGSGLSKDAKDWIVTLGEHHLKNEDWFEQSRQVKAIYVHPEYTGAENKVTDDELKAIPPDYDVGKSINTAMLSSILNVILFMIFISPIITLPIPKNTAHGIAKAREQGFPTLPFELTLPALRASKMKNMALAFL